MTTLPIDLDRATLVAFYGAKPASLDRTVRALQDAASSVLGTRFRPRAVDDVHATLMGLDQPAENGVAPHLAQAVRHLLDVLRSERVVLQFGGFSPGERTITSRGRSLHDRTLGVVARQIVLIGWPVREAPLGRAPSMRLADLRYEFERYGFRHKYHAPGMGPDPDAYMVLGEVDDADGVDAHAIAAITRGGGLQDAILVDLTPDSVFLVEYHETSLARASSRWWTLDSADAAMRDGPTPSRRCSAAP
ncbi:hypothetical protein [Pseudonocardia cypriaca]|uniref:hypothetical protein n=1 Tax=Pseudonocardia cypriaca TaxID=882449 RepID=UPI00114F6773|nr:hypothetical protein [Pseudonocardia cypriaca]